jgi:hypothetical protein
MGQSVFSDVIPPVVQMPEHNGDIRDLARSLFERVTGKPYVAPPPVQILQSVARPRRTPVNWIKHPWDRLPRQLGPAILEADAVAAS